MRKGNAILRETLHVRSVNIARAIHGRVALAVIVEKKKDDVGSDGFSLGEDAEPEEKKRDEAQPRLPWLAEASQRSLEIRSWQ